MSAFMDLQYFKERFMVNNFILAINNLPQLLSIRVQLCQYILYCVSAGFKVPSWCHLSIHHLWGHQTLQAVASCPEGSQDNMTGVTYSQTVLSGQEWYFHLPPPSEIPLLRKSRNSPAAVPDGHQELCTALLICNWHRTNH